VAAIAVLDLFGVDFGINRWLVPRAALPGSGAASFEMINGMPLAIALAAGSLALSRFEGHHFTTTVLAGLVGGMAVFALLTYLTGIHRSPVHPAHDSLGRNLGLRSALPPDQPDSRSTRPVGHAGEPPMCSAR
jgi:hypothetical protein